jgi:hypothetical protein
MLACPLLSLDDFQGKNWYVTLQRKEQKTKRKGGKRERGNAKKEEEKVEGRIGVCRCID